MFTDYYYGIMEMASWKWHLYTCIFSAEPKDTKDEPVKQDTKETKKPEIRRAAAQQRPVRPSVYYSSLEFNV